MNQKTLKTELQYIQDLEKFEEIKPGLQTMQTLMAALGNPHHTFESIHIAGTNGKGSTATFLSSVLNQTNQRIGLYTSPHLTEFNERVKVQSENIDNLDLINLINQVRTVSEQEQIKPTYFEFTTALAFLHFSQLKVDLAIIEVGMGGLLDATNVITPLLSIITNIGHDHTNWLGATKKNIAQRKAGIIKPGIPVVTAETDPAILKYFNRRCHELNAPLHIVQQHLATGITDQSLTQQTVKILLNNNKQTLPDTITIKLLGQHQVTNAATALTAIDVLKTSNKALSKSAIQRGFKQASWPGRLEIISHQPFTLIDGAHNPEGIEALAKFLDDYQRKLPTPDVLVLGAKLDKDITPYLEHLVPRFRHIICTESNYQPMPAHQLAKKLSANKLPATSYPASGGTPPAGGGSLPTSIQIEPNLTKALKLAQQQLKPDHLLLITGSLYLVGDVLSAFLKKDRS